MKEETRNAAKAAAEECYKRYSQNDMNFDDDGYFYVSLIEDIYMEAVEWAMKYNGKQGCKAGKKEKIAHIITNITDAKKNEE